MEWNAKEEDYLNSLAKSCKELSVRFKQIYDKYLSYQTKFRIPSIVISSTLGLMSFGNSQFGDGAGIVSIVVGVCNVILGIMGSAEAYLKIGETMSGALLASNKLQKLCENIHLELALPVEERSSTGLMFLRSCFSQYEQILDNAPSVLKKLRFVVNSGIVDLEVQSSSSLDLENGSAKSKVIMMK